MLNDYQKKNMKDLQAKIKVELKSNKYEKVFVAHKMTQNISQYVWSG